MIGYPKALALVINQVRAVPVESVSINRALGRILAGDVVAPFPIPPFSSSAADGYAVRARDVARATEAHPVTLRLDAAVHAGDSAPARLKPLQAFRIFTGAPVSPGVDAVVMQERVQSAGGFVTLVSPVREGENIRRRGAEFRKGRTVLRRGTPVTPPVIGLLATLGCRRVRVHCKPRVAIVVTGNELQWEAKALTGGAIYDSNSPALAASLEALGVPPVLMLRARDSAPEIKAALVRALGAADVVISSGGVSVGDRDFVRDVCRSIGIRQVFWRVAIKPGKPNFFGTKGKKLLFGVPGNPVAALLSFHLLIRPALFKMMGTTIAPALLLTARMEVRVTKKAGRAEFLRATLRTDEHGELLARPVRGRDSHMLGGLAAADCLVHFSERASELRAGQKVAVTLLRWSQG
jgi:molybdopterin molybdotransferase